jgi:hypothetical protein
MDNFNIVGFLLQMVASVDMVRYADDRMEGDIDE